MQYVYEELHEQKKANHLISFCAPSRSFGTDFLPDCVTQAGNRHDRCGSQDFKSCVPEASGYQFHPLYFSKIELTSSWLSFNLRINTDDFIFFINLSNEYA